MPERTLELPSIVHVKSIHMGQVDKLRPWLLPDEASALVENFDIDRPGQRRRRRGVADIGARTEAARGVWRAFDATLNQEAIWASWGGNVFILPGGGVVQQRASGVSLTDVLHQFVEGREAGKATTFIVSACVADSDPSLASKLLMITSDNLFTQVASIAPRCATWFQNRLWIADNVLNQTDQSVWWSELNNGTLFSNLNVLRPEVGQGGRVTALLAIRGFTPTIVAFKERAISVIEPFWGVSSSLIPAAADALDTVKTNIRLISNAAGCVANKSVQFVPGAPDGDVFFLSLDGVRVLRRAQDDSIAGISEPITDAIKETIDRINFAYARKAVSAFVDRHYYLAVPLDGATENTHVLDYNLDHKSWQIHTWAPKDLVGSRANNETVERLWMQYNKTTGDCSVTGITSGLHVFKCFSGLVDPSGAAVIYREDTRAFDFGDLSTKKRWDHALFVVRNDSVTTATFGVLYNVDDIGFNTAASFSFGGLQDDPILGVTPLPWAAATGQVRVLKMSLADAPPGYFLQLRIQGHSDFGDPSIHDVAVAARPVYMEMDNLIG